MSFNSLPLKRTIVEFGSSLILSIVNLSTSPPLWGAYTINAVEYALIESILSMCDLKSFQQTR